MRSKPFTLRALSAALLFCLILVLLPCGAWADTYTVRQSLREESPELIFDLNYLPEGDYFYTDLITVRHPDGSFLQQIPLDPKAETYDSETLGFLLQDMNFDGYLDIALMQYVSMGADMPFFCYLWDPATQTFLHSAELSALSSPSFDPATGEIHSYERTEQDVYVDALYRYENGALSLIQQVITAYDLGGNVIIYTTETMIDGVLQVTERRQEPFEIEVPEE